MKVGIHVFPRISNPFGGIAAIHLANPGLNPLADDCKQLPLLRHKLNGDPVHAVISSKNNRFFNLSKAAPFSRIVIMRQKEKGRSGGYQHRPHFLDGHRLSSLYREGILNVKISLVKYSGRAREGWPSRMARSAIDAARNPAQAETGEATP